MAEEQETFEIHSILEEWEDGKEWEGERWFWVKWADRKYKNSWVAESDIKCPELIADFRAQQREKKEKKKGNKKKTRDISRKGRKTANEETPASSSRDSSTPSVRSGRKTANDDTPSTSSATSSSSSLLPVTPRDSFIPTARIGRKTTNEEPPTSSHAIISPPKESLGSASTGEQCHSASRQSSHDPAELAEAEAPSVAIDALERAEEEVSNGEKEEEQAFRLVPPEHCGYDLGHEGAIVDHGAIALDDGREVDLFKVFFHDINCEQWIPAAVVEEKDEEGYLDYMLALSYKKRREEIAAGAAAYRAVIAQRAREAEAGAAILSNTE